MKRQSTILLYILAMLSLSGFSTLTLGQTSFTRITTGFLGTHVAASYSHAWIDTNQDGNVDLYISDNQLDLTPNVYYINLGGGSFTFFGSPSIGQADGTFLDCTWGDMDNNGYPDFFISESRRNQLNLLKLNNNGQTFTEVTDQLPVIDSVNAYSGATWADYDNDGFLDLFLVSSDPLAPNRVYRNLNGSNFEPQINSPIASAGGNSSSVTLADIDNDGDLDVFITNLGVPNQAGEPNALFINVGPGTFISAAPQALTSDAGFSTGASWGDFNNDGLLDVFVTNDFSTVNVLYQNIGEGVFRRVADSVFDQEFSNSTSSGWADYDNDGDLDLFVCSRYNVEIDLGPNFLYSNNGDGTFTQVTDEPSDEDGGFSLSTSWVDYDNNGFPDLFVANANQENRLYQNLGNTNNWLQVNCIASISNGSAIGARVEVLATIDDEPLWQYREITAKSGGRAQGSMIPAFGLGNATVADSIVIKWPSGTRSFRSNVAANQILQIAELDSEPIGSVVVQVNDSVSVGSAVVISAQPPADFTPITANLFYRRGGGINYFQQPLTLEGDTYFGSISEEDTDIRGIEYYVAFTDGSRTFTFPELFPVENPAVLRTTFSELTPSFALATGSYQMISIPAVLEDQNPLMQLGDDYGTYLPDSWRLLRWDPEMNTYSEIPFLNANLSPGNAFWLIKASEEVFDLGAGVSVPTNTNYTITLEPGWNQISSPFAFPVLWEDIFGWELVQRPNFWNGETYVPGQIVLLPWQGYFVLNPNLEPVQLQVSHLEASVEIGKSNTRQLASNEFRLQFRLEGLSTQQNDHYNYVGFIEGAKEGVDVEDYLEPPAITEKISLVIREGNNRYAGNFLSPNSNGASWDLEITSPLVAEKGRLSFDNLRDLPANFNVWLLDLDARRSLAINGNQAVVDIPAAGDLHRYRLIIGTENFAESVNNDISLIPTVFSLGQNYPNPFNPLTQIPYEVDQSGNTTIDIYNVLGQLVRTLVDDWREPGSYIVEWDGRADNGQRVVSGVYLYQLRLGSQEQSRKMIFLQ